MTAADIDSVYAIEKLAYDFPWAKSIFEQTVSSSKYAVVLDVESEVCGYAVTSYVVGEAELLNICISPLHQKKGYGVKLMEHIIDQAVKSGNTDMYLEVRENNVAALHIYEQAGFNEIGRRNNYYPSKNGREDAVLMALPLAL